MLRSRLKKNETAGNHDLKATHIKPQDTKHCVCDKCHNNVPYVSRRCLVVEDKNGTINLFGKSFILTNICINCLRES